MYSRTTQPCALTQPPVDGVLEAIGHTPLVRLRRVHDGPLRVFAKLEASNPGGSAKDRTATRIILDAIARGEIGPHTTVVESTSGNLGVGLAQVCGYHGIPVICVTDVRASELNRRRMEALGADVHMISEPDPANGDLLTARLLHVQRLLEAIPNAYWPSQYRNPSNPAAHRDGTMREIDEALDGAVDAVVIATSTVGTLRGCGDYIRDAGLDTRVVAVDVLGSVLFGGRAGPRKLPGMGAGVTPFLEQGAAFDHLVRVSDLECVVGCRRLAEREAILAGASSGGVVVALERLAHELPPGGTCVLILPDGGAPYMPTVFDDEWVARELGCDRSALRRLVESDLVTTSV